MYASDPIRDATYLARLVRERDRPRYYATLFAPETIRADLFALYGFAAEIARVPDQVSEPTLGEIRLQYWRDALEAAGAGQRETPILRALSGTIVRRSLPLAPLIALVEARRADLYSDPPARLTDVEGFLGETQSSLFQLAALICGAQGSDTAEAAGHAGIAYGIARRLARFAVDKARGRTILPLDLLAMEGLGAQDVFATEPSSGLQKTILALIALARHHRRNAGERIGGLPRNLQLPFLPLATSGSLLDRVERLGPAILQEPAELSDFEALSRIAWARFGGM